MRDLEQELVELLAECSSDPYRFVLRAFPWGEPNTELATQTGPDEWQTLVLKQIRDGLVTASQAIQEAVASGHGVGKSALVAWLMLWGLSTFEDTKGVVTANTETQLRTKTWPELAKWHRLFIAKHWFSFTATALYSVDPNHEKTWRLDAIAWSERNTEAFAGLHNQGKRVLVFYDEASAIPDVIWETTEGALTDSDTQILWCVFGNPTRNTGRFRECFGRFRHRWHVHQVDSRTAKLTNKEQINQWIADYGEDSDFVRVRVRGVFPRAGSMQFISSEVAEHAASPHFEVSATLMDPLIMGVDVARFGDDQSVIAFRRGRDARSEPWITFRGVDTMTLAARIIEESQRLKPDAIFVDGGGPGGGVVDRLRMFHLPVIEVQFGGKADRSQPSQEGRVVYANKRAEMWGLMRDWLPGAMIPVDIEMIADLTGLEYGYVMREGLDAIQLERKEDMKKRGLSSPDKGDALCFEAGTLIQTPQGAIPIEILEVGDLVDTPFGPSRIAIKWRSETDMITTATFSNGSILRGKGEHKIFAWNAGVVRLDALTSTLEVEPYSKWRISLWQSASALLIGARNTTFRVAVDTIARDTPLTAKGFCIAAFGWTITDLFRPAWSFTTRMRIGATIQSTTSKSWPKASMANITCTNAISALGVWKPHTQPWTRPALQQLSGTAPGMVWHGTQSTAKRHGGGAKESAQFAPYVPRPIGHSSHPDRDFAPDRVCSMRHTSGLSLMFGRVIGVAKHLLRIAMRLPRVVAISVVTESVPPTSVYNLTLERHNAYYANGILAYNCLTFAYPVAQSDHSGVLSTRRSRHETDYFPQSELYGVARGR